MSFELVENWTSASGSPAILATTRVLREGRPSGSPFHGAALLCADVLAIVTAAFIVKSVGVHSNSHFEFGVTTYLFAGWSSALAFTWLRQLTRSYAAPGNEAKQPLLQLAALWFIACALTFSLHMMIGLNDAKWPALLLFFALGLVLLLGAARMISKFGGLPLLSGRETERNVLQCFLGSAATTGNASGGPPPIAYAVDTLATQIAEAARANDVDEVQIISSVALLEQISGALERLRSMPLSVLYVPRDEFSWIFDSRKPGPVRS